MRLASVPLRVALLLLCMAGLVFGVDEWRTFESPDGGKAFTAKLVGFNPTTASVTVVMQANNKKVSFPLSKLKPEDQEFVKKQAQLLAAKSSFRIAFDKVMTQKGKKTEGDTTTTTYDGFFQVKVGNYSPNTIRNVQVDYIVIWREDSFEGMGDEQIVRGNQTVANIFANNNHQVTTKIVDLKAVYQKGRVEVDERAREQIRRNPALENQGVPSLSFKSQRSRDQLVGCIVQISVDGQVILAEASSPTLMKYQDAFILAEEEGKDGAGKDKDGKEKKDKDGK